jgi:2-phosphosulfolactate phosphatase
VAVVFDVLRATTTLVHALAAGAEAVVVAPSLDEAMRQRDKDPGVLLAGEEGMLPPMGFDLGNSPTQYTREAVMGRRIVMATTNGTKALLAVGRADRVYVGALVNAREVATRLRGARRVLLLPSGTQGNPCLEDLLGAGAVLDRLAEGSSLDLDPVAYLALDAYRTASDELTQTLLRTPNGRRLVDKGFGDDVRLAAQTDRFAIAPCVSEGLPLTIRREP